MKSLYVRRLVTGFMLLFLISYTPLLWAWERGGSPPGIAPLDIAAQNERSQGGDENKKAVERSRQPTTPVYNVEMAKPNPPAIKRPPVPPVTDGQIQHARPLDAPNTPDSLKNEKIKITPVPPIQRQASERDMAQPRPPLGQRPPSDRPDNLKPTVQPPFGVGNTETSGVTFNNTPPHNPFDADKNRHNNPRIKPVFEPHERPVLNSEEIRPPHFKDNRGHERPTPGPIIVDKIRPARGMGFYQEMPSGHQRVFVRNQWYFSHEGRFYRRVHNGFIWIAPPVGLVVTTLPLGCTSFIWSGVEYYTYAGIYYRPVYGGSIVVEEPDDLPPIWDMDPPPFAFVIVNTEILNVRTGPGEDFPVIEQALSGERLQVLGSYEDWYYIRLANGRRGWVLAYFTYPENGPEPQG